MSNFIFEYQMIDTSLCDRLIEYFHNSEEYKGKGHSTGGENKHTKKLSTDLSVNIYASNNPVIHEYRNHVINAVQSYMKKHIHLKSAMDISQLMNIQYYKPGEGYFNWHCERNLLDETKRSLVFMTYLNDVSDGGETEFYYQGIKFKPTKGMTLIWPPDFTHTHRGITSKTQEKYIATGWFEWASVMSVINQLTNQNR
jgi:hypothetical protein